MGIRDDTINGLSQDLKIVALSIFGIPLPDVSNAAPTNVDRDNSAQPMVGMASGQGAPGGSRFL